MREYLFRGKRKGYKEWQFGSLHIIEWDKPAKAKGDYIDYRILGRHNECSYVDPETVGQYGLNDKNGVKIFEGDIVVCNRQINDVFDKKTFLVGEISPISGLVGKSLSGNWICDADWEFAEVIGNIHDNPELLKEGGEE